MNTHQQPCPCAYCRTDEINEELFAVPESKSPRLLWMEKHGFLTHYHGGFTGRFGEPEPWMAILPYKDDKGKDIGTIMEESCRLYDECGRIGYGQTEDEAITQLALELGIKLWHEEGFKP